MSTASSPPEEALSRYLLEAAYSFPGEKTTVREILERVGERGMLVLCVALCVPFLVPVSIPGVSTIFGFAITVAALAVSSRRLPWLPRRMLEKEVATAKLRATFEAGARRLEKLEGLLRPRIEPVASLTRLNGLVLAFTGILLMAPFGLVPFSNTVPAIAAILLALGMLHRDGAFVLAGYASTALTLVYFAVLIGAAIYGGMELALRSTDPRPLSLPDAITLSRLLLAAPFGYLLFAGYPRWALLAVFALAALTDGLDGLVARRLGQVSPQGARLDQRIDRAFTAVIACLLLAHEWLVEGEARTEALRPGPGLPLLLGLACTREIVGLPGVLLAWLRKVPPYHVEYVGKLATFVQSVTLGSIVLGVPWALYLALPCAVIGVLSGANYLRYSLAVPRG